MSSELILRETRALPLAERIDICRNLWDEILKSKEWTPGEAKFIDDRMQDHLDNPDDVVTFDEVNSKLDTKYRR